MMPVVSCVIVANIAMLQGDMCDQRGDTWCLTCLGQAGAPLGPTLGLALGSVLPGVPPVLGLKAAVVASLSVALASLGN